MLTNRFHYLKISCFLVEDNNHEFVYRLSRFLDERQMLQCSLAALIKNCSDDNKTKQMAHKKADIAQCSVLPVLGGNPEFPMRQG